MIEWKETEIGNVPTHWEVSTIGHIGDVTKLAGFEYTKYFSYVDDGEVIALRALNVREGVLDLSDIKRIYKNVSDELPRSKLYKNDILFTYVGANIGQFAIIPEDDKYHLAPNICRIRCSDQYEPYFLFCYFRSTFFKESLDGFSHGSSQPTMPMGSIRQIPVPLPPLSEQKAIASVLSCLDDKIDHLHRQNKTLEAMAEALFRAVNSEQGKEKSEKRKMKKEEDSWVEGKLPDEFDFIMGQSPVGTSFNENKIGIPMYQGNADFGFRFPAERVYTTEPTRFAEPFDTLVSVRAPVGEQNMALEKCCIGRGVAAFRYKHNKDYYTYTYFKIRSLLSEIQQFNDEGTVFGSIGKTDFEEMKITIPPQSVIIDFEKQAKPINDKVIKNCLQIRTLERLRDTLLPKLMSGEVRVEI